MTTEVYIWRTFAAPKSIGGRGSSSTFGRLSRLIGGFGHVALEVDHHYLSWWPPEEQGEPHSFSYAYPEDVDRCGRNQDRVISIPGLAEDAMLDTWRSLTRGRFDEVDLNCCTVAARVLFTGWETAMDNGSFTRTLGQFWRYVKRPVDGWWSLVRYSLRENSVHSPGEVEEFADWLKYMQGT